MLSNHLSFIILLKLRTQIWVEHRKNVKHMKYLFATDRFCEKLGWLFYDAWTDTQFPVY